VPELSKLGTMSIYPIIPITSVSMPNSLIETLLPKNEWDILQQFLESDKVDDALDITETHGFLCSMAVGPIQLDEKEWLEFIFDTSPRFIDEEEENQVKSLLAKLYLAINTELSSGLRLLIPCKLSLHPDPDLAPLRAWACGFMEGMLTFEDQWFEQDEEIIAELTLPLLLASGLAEDEEIQQLQKNKSLCDSLCREIPEVLTDIFLFFHGA